VLRLACGWVPVLIAAAAASGAAPTPAGEEPAPVHRPFPATVVGSGVRARNGADTYADVVFGLRDGDSVTVLGQDPHDPRWYRIEAGPGKLGWVWGELLQPGFRPEEVARLRESREGAVLYLVVVTGPPARPGAALKCTAQVEPIMVVSRGRLSAPKIPGGGESRVEADRRYLPRGQSRRLLQGGAEVGEVTIGQPEPRENPYVSLVSTGEVEGAIECRQGALALATDSPVIGSKRSSRRALSEEETRGVQALARERFETRGLRKELANGFPVTIRSALWADLDGDGRDELVASAFFEEFLPDCSHEVAFVVEDGVPRQLWGYDGDFEMGAEGLVVDHLDLDGDGASEIVLRLEYSANWDFAAFRRVGGEWVEVYHGGGGGY